MLASRVLPRSTPSLVWRSRCGRPFSSTKPFLRPNTHRKESFATRLSRAWRRTPIQWKPIPIGLGIAFLGVFQFYRVQERERRKQEAEWLSEHHDGDEEGGVLHRKKRKRIRPSGPWSVQIMSTLPLKFLSRLWGKCNELDIPYYLRIPGFKLYGFIFGVDFDEVSEPDLHNYRNLAQFFYRTLKPGVRPLDQHPNALLSPADGRVIQFGYIEHGEVEQVKGVTYSVDALLGSEPAAGTHNAPTIADPSVSSNSKHREGGDSELILADEEFARVNGISYTLPNLFSGRQNSPKVVRDREGSRITAREDTQQKPSDQSTTPGAGSEAEVTADLALSPRAPRPWYYPAAKERPMGLYYCVGLSRTRRLPSLPLSRLVGSREQKTFRRRALQRFTVSATNSARLVYFE